MGQSTSRAQVKEQQEDVDVVQTTLRECPEQGSKRKVMALLAATREIQHCDAQTPEDCNCRANAQKIEKGLLHLCPKSKACPALMRNEQEKEV